MFKVKQVAMFDKDLVKVGDFITFCPLYAGDQGNYDEQGPYLNALITSVKEDELILTDLYGIKKHININDIAGAAGVEPGEGKYMIIGIQPHVVGLREGR